MLNDVPIGGGPSERIGRKLLNKSLLLRYRTVFSTGTGFPNRARILVVYDKSPNASLPTVTDILSGSTFNAGTSLSNSHRFVIIVDEMTEQNMAGAATANPGECAFSGQIFRKFRLETHYNALTTGDQNNITGGAFYFLYALDSNVPAGDYTTAIFSRIRFIDA